DEKAGHVLFNDGQIGDAKCGKLKDHEAFRQIVEITGGVFDFQKSAQSFPVTIEAPSNTNLILDSLRQVDEERARVRTYMSSQISSRSSIPILYLPVQEHS